MGTAWGPVADGRLIGARRRQDPDITIERGSTIRRLTWLETNSTSRYTLSNVIAATVAEVLAPLKGGEAG